MSGTLERVAVQRGGQVIRFERRFKQPVEEVWAALTQPDRLGSWLAHPNAKFAQGEKVDLRFDNTGVLVHTTVTKAKRPNLLEYTWDSQEVPARLPDRAANISGGGGGQCLVELSGNRVRWALASVDGGTLVTLSHTLSSPAASLRRAGTASGRLPAPKEKLENVLASWHHHLDLLTQALGAKGGTRAAGQPTRWVWDRWDDLREKYAQAVS